MFIVHQCKKFSKWFCKCKEGCFALRCLLVPCRVLLPRKPQMWFEKWKQFVDIRVWQQELLLIETSIQCQWWWGRIRGQFYHSDRCGFNRKKASRRSALVCQQAAAVPWWQRNCDRPVWKNDCGANYPEDFLSDETCQTITPASINLPRTTHHNLHFQRQSRDMISNAGHRSVIPEGAGTHRVLIIMIIGERNTDYQLIESGWWMDAWWFSPPAPRAIAQKRIWRLICTCAHTAHYYWGCLGRLWTFDR